MDIVENRKARKMKPTIKISYEDNNKIYSLKTFTFYKAEDKILGKKLIALTTHTENEAPVICFSSESGKSRIPIIYSYESFLELFYVLEEVEVEIDIKF